MNSFQKRGGPKWDYDHKRRREIGPTFCYKVIVLLLLKLLSTVIHFNKHLSAIVDDDAMHEALRQWIDNHCTKLLFMERQWWKYFILRRALTTVTLVVTLIYGLRWRWIWQGNNFTNCRVKFHAISISCEEEKSWKLEKICKGWEKVIWGEKN